MALLPERMIGVPDFFFRARRLRHVRVDEESS